MRHLLSYLAFLSLILGIHAARDPMRLTHGPMLGNPTSDSVRVGEELPILENSPFVMEQSRVNLTKYRANHHPYFQ